MDTTSYRLNQLLMAIITPLIRYPDDLKVQTDCDSQKITFIISSNADDTPKLIGGGGAIINAIKRVLNEAAKLEQSWEIDAEKSEARAESRPVEVIIEEPNVGENFGRRPFAPNLKWNAENHVLPLLRELHDKLLGGGTDTLKPLGRDAVKVIISWHCKSVHEKTPDDKLTLAEHIAVLFYAIGMSTGKKLSVMFEDTKGNKPWIPSVASRSAFALVMFEDTKGNKP